MKCSVCGAEIGLDEKVCPGCGKPVEEKQEQTFGDVMAEALESGAISGEPETAGAGEEPSGAVRAEGTVSELPTREDGAAWQEESGQPPKSGKKKGIIIGAAAAVVVAAGALAFGLMGREDPKEVVIQAFENVYTEDQVMPLEELFGVSQFSENALTADVEDSMTLILEDCSEPEVSALAGSGLRVVSKTDKTNKKGSADIAVIYKDMDLATFSGYFGDDELMMTVPQLSSKVFTIDLGEGLAERVQNSPLAGPALEASGVNVEGLFTYFEEQLQMAESGQAMTLDLDGLMTRYKEGTQAQEKFKEALTVEKAEKGTFTMDGEETACKGYTVLVSKDSMMEFLRTTTDFFLNDKELKDEFLKQLEQTVKLTELMGGASAGLSASELYADGLEDVSEAVNTMIDFLDKSLTDVNMTVYVDKKGRLAAVDGSTRLLNPDDEEETLLVDFNCRLQGGSYLTQNAAAEVVMKDGTDQLTVSLVKNGTYDGKQLTGDLAVNVKLDGDEKVDGGFTCTGTYNSDGGDYHMGMSLTGDGSLLADLSMSGIVNQLEKGTSIQADIDELKITVMDAMGQVTLSGDYSYGPLSSEVSALDGETFDILAAGEEDWQSVIMEIYMNVMQLASQLSY